MPLPLFLRCRVGLNLRASPERLGALLCTGGAGFIASHVARRLVTQYPQYKVHSTKPQNKHRALCSAK